MFKKIVFATYIFICFFFSISALAVENNSNATTNVAVSSDNSIDKTVSEEKIQNTKGEEMVMVPKTQREEELKMLKDISKKLDNLEQQEQTNSRRRRERYYFHDIDGVCLFGIKKEGKCIRDNTPIGRYIFTTLTPYVTMSSSNKYSNKHGTIESTDITSIGLITDVFFRDETVANFVGLDIGVVIEQWSKKHESKNKYYVQGTLGSYFKIATRFGISYLGKIRNRFFLSRPRVGLFASAGVLLPLHDKMYYTTDERPNVKLRESFLLEAGCDVNFGVFDLVVGYRYINVMETRKGKQDINECFFSLGVPFDIN